MTRLLSVSSSRADIGILAPVWRAFVERPGTELHILLTGMHCAGPESRHPEVPAGATVHLGGEDLAGQGDVVAARAMASIGTAAAELCARIEPDAMLVIGDRLDMIPAALATLPFNLPLVHLHGGELSLGAVDDRSRHALTKLSHIHCAATVEAAERISGMGEESWRIHVTGAPGLDGLLSMEPIEQKAFAAMVGLDAIADMRLVTVHPETNSKDPTAVLRPILEALARRPAPTLFTGSNADSGGAVMRRQIENFVAEHDWATFRDTLGHRLYASAMQHATVMVGNSSSGIIEAGLYGLPVVNVGRRQEGRSHGENVYDVTASADAIGALLERVNNTPRHARACNSLYGDGKAGPRIAEILGTLPERDILLFKRFANTSATFNAPWNCVLQPVAQHG